MKYYCIGIKGTGMSTLAQMLYDMGNEVSGYDDAKDYKFTQKGLEKRGIKIFYDGNHSIDKDTIVTASRAFSDEHPEMKRVKELGLTFKPYNEVVGEITKEFDTISVSGTHGKTTTTSLLKHLFENTIGCNYFIGDGTGHIDMKNRLLVIESDEFNRHFLAYHPKKVIITCIELEHTEIYKDIEDTIKTFEEFANKAETVIANGDDLNIRKINFKNKVVFYGEDESNDYIIKDIKLETTGSTFTLYKKDELIDTFTVPLYGHHMVMNTVASIISALDEGVSKEKIKELLPTFKNANRRFAETKVGDTIIVDDYAHHPTEVKVTLEAIRQKYPDKKLTVVFRPNTYSRTSRFKKEFADALKVADKVYLTPIKCDREDPKDYPPIKSEDIIELIPGSELVDDDTVSKVLKDKDGVVAFMGCATVSHLIENFTKALENIE
ncbi:MAG TPA: UDP-N-acetylmuramate--L-alanine ligase [Candidatus Onthousia excrementipullorum]|uniref:UDP-N-acetylmuramate--L-alanine ligase n=1 Tax=Candidatus Onthousia excrementipullorum TaxID=2840884 RepID=A0A9D1DVI1_9FIRM|nr:UDP-N-acetylmuramate--L-alanine ligase [Candidatus Onthousia excrementipullorum]